jgi:drug/metabolite transporter, DME family
MPSNGSDVVIGRPDGVRPDQATTGFSAASNKSVRAAINGRMSPGRARIAVVAAALLFSTGGAAIKVESFSAAEVSAVRSGLAAIVLLLWVRGRVEWSFRVIAIGAVYASVLTLFVAATKLTTAANAIFLQSTAPLFILMLAPAFLGERFYRRDLLYVAGLAAGLALCFVGRAPATTIAPNPPLGNIFGIASSLSWAVTLVLLRWGQRRDGNIGPSAVAVGNLIASAGALVFALPFPSASAGEWMTLVYLGVVQIGVAYILLTAAMRELQALEVSLLLLLEPVLNPVWTWLVRDERPGAWVIAGGALIIAATAARSLHDARSSRSL